MFQETLSSDIAAAEAKLEQGQEEKPETTPVPKPPRPRAGRQPPPVQTISSLPRRPPLREGAGARLAEPRQTNAGMNA